MSKGFANLAVMALNSTHVGCVVFRDTALISPPYSVVLTPHDVYVHYSQTEEVTCLGFDTSGL